MEVRIISKRQQEFNGEVYWKCGFYFQRYGKRLHREVWEYHNNNIQEGFAIHHLDFDCTNNQIENLVCIPESTHCKLHSKRNVELGVIGEFSQACRDAAAKWHGSEEGKNWHKIHYENNKKALHKRVIRECTQCGTLHETNRGHAENSFCRGYCKTKFRKLSGVDNISRFCEQCGSEYIVNKYSKNKYCSKVCANTSLSIAKTGKPRSKVNATI